MLWLKLQTLKSYYNNKYPKKNITYRRTTRKGTIEIDVRQFLNPHNFMLPDIRGKDDDETAFNGLMWVIKNIKYTADKKQYGLSEYWCHGYETFNTKKGDCIANYEEIYTKDGLKKVGDLKVGDLVLSYDFSTQEYVYKPIIKIWEKGKLPIKRVHLRNGTYVDITSNHPLWVRTNQSGKSKYVKKYLSEIDLEKCYTRKLPVVKKLPYKIKDIEWIDEDMAFLIGYFLAEGCIHKDGRVEISGYKLIDHIIPILEKKGIRFRERVNNSGVPVIYILDKELKDFFREFKGEDTLSFSAKIPEYILNLPENKLEKIIEGYFLGDGHHVSHREDKRGYASNEEYILSTSSDDLASAIQQIGLRIGKPFYLWKQLHHGGAGKRPIWRISYNPNSYFARNYGYRDISEVSITYIEDLGETEMRDFEVEDTHTFIFKNGLISHQCEDGAILLYDILRKNGIPAWKLRVTAGWVKVGKSKAGHAYLTYYSVKHDKWVILDWCFYPSYRKIADREPYYENPFYLDVWFSFNEEYAWAKAVGKEAKEFLKNK